MLNPLAFAAALAAMASPAQDKTLPERQAAFLKSIQAGKIQEAYTDLLKGSLILEKKADVDNLVGQTEKGIEIYGGVSGVEDLGLVRQNRNVAFGVAIVACEKAPLFFYFVWYRPREDAPWKSQNVWFDDKSRAFFEMGK